MRSSLLILLSVYFLVSCEKSDIDYYPFTIKNYSFFVAGHTYDDSGVYPPFKEKFEYITNNELIKFGVLTGDIVRDGLPEQWDSVDYDIAELEMPVYFAIGNHDNKNRVLYKNRYGETYYSFTYENDLFIILDPNIDSWNISGHQLFFLKRVLHEMDNLTENIFVFFHQLLWRKSDNKYSEILPNSNYGKADSINFWYTVEPLFSNLTNNVIMFSGDVGGGDWSSDYMYDKYGNITLIATGMGDGEGDNFVIVNVSEKDLITYELISLNCEDIHCLGNLEDFILP